MMKLPPSTHAARSSLVILRGAGVGALAMLVALITPSAVRADADGGADAAPDATIVDSGTVKDASTSSGGQDSGTPPKPDAAVSVIDSGTSDAGDTRYIDGSTADSCSVHGHPRLPPSAPVLLLASLCAVIAIRRHARSSSRSARSSS